MKAEIVYTNKNNEPRVLLTFESDEERTLFNDVDHLDAGMATSKEQDEEVWVLESISFKVRSHHPECEHRDCHPECDISREHTTRTLVQQ